MVWKEDFFLRLWVRYYGGLVGKANLFVISHGQDDRTAEIAEGCNLVVIPRDEPDAHFDETRWEMLSDFASGLTRYYDHVIVSDVDELIISLDGQPLTSRLTAISDPVTAPAGYEIVPEHDTEIDEDQPILSQCFKGVLSATYSKPCILSAPARLSAGGHGSKTRPVIDPELALLHLRFLNTREQVERRKHRKAIADQATANSDRNQGNFLRGWRKAEQIRQKIAEQFRNAPEVSSTDAQQRVSDILEAARQVKGGTHSFSVPKVRERDIRLVLEPDLRTLF